MSRHRIHPPDHYDSEGRHLPPEGFPPGKEAPGDLEALRQFVNTVNLENGADRLADPTSMAAWLERRRRPGWSPPHGRITSRQWRAVIEVRESLRDLIDDRPGAAAALDSAARRAPLAVRFGPDEVRLEPVAGGIEGYLAWLVGVVYTAVRDGTWSRLKVCPKCRWAFFDHSRNRSGNWCAMKACGDRTKARTYRRRQSDSEERSNGAR